MVLDWGCFVYIYLQSLDIEYIHHLYPRSSCTNLYQKKNHLMILHNWSIQERGQEFLLVCKSFVKRKTRFAKISHFLRTKIFAKIFAFFRISFACEKCKNFHSFSRNFASLCFAKKWKISRNK